MTPWVSSTLPPANRHDSLTTLRSRITADAQELRRRGRRPRQVYLTPDNALQLQYELIGQGGSLGHQILVDGIGRALSTIDGLTIVWKSRQYKVA